MTGRIQKPSNPNNWLYQDWDSQTRVFTKEAFLADNQQDLPECTDEEMKEWKRKHPDPEQ